MLIKQIFHFAIISLLFILITGCDGFRQLRADIKLQKEEVNQETVTNTIIELARKNGFTCKTKNNDLYFCGKGPTLIEVHMNKNNGILSIYLREFGPIGPTNAYQNLHKDLSEYIKTHFKENSVTINPPICSNVVKKEFNVEFPNKIHPLLSWIPHSVEPEFGNAATEIKKVAEKYNMEYSLYQGKESPMGRIPSSVWCEGGEYIGTQASVRIEVRENNNSSGINITIYDFSCNESQLTKNLYKDLLSAMTNMFGEKAIIIQ